MFLTSIVVLFLFSAAERVQCESDVDVEIASVSVNESCSQNETECALGCCPFKDGVCCIDGFECCEHGKTCIPFIGVCIGPENNKGRVFLTSNKSTRVRGSVSDCPVNMTACGKDKCCIYKNATCCNDGRHCCPNGFRCDVPRQRCVPDPFKKISRNYYGVDIFDKKLTKMSKNSHFKTCPGGNRMCPSYMNCCILDNGEWGCCRNPSLRQIRYGGSECYTIFGPEWCPDHYTCTLLGCIYLD